MAVTQKKKSKNSPQGKAGRRTGDTTTRTDILSAAKTVFAQYGYDNASVRTIATQAKVDPALIRHFFGSKEKLFLHLIADQSTPAPSLENFFSDTHPQERGKALVSLYLQVWNSPDTQPLLLALTRSALTSQEASSKVTTAAQELFTTGMLGIGRQHVDPIAFALMSSQLLGIAIGRYIMRLPHMVRLSDQRIINELSPVIQQYLDGTYQTEPAYINTYSFGIAEFPSMDAPVSAPSRTKPSGQKEKTENPAASSAPATATTAQPYPNPANTETTDETPSPEKEKTEEPSITAHGFLLTEEHPTSTTPEPTPQKLTSSESTAYTRPHALDNAHEPTLFDNETHAHPTPKTRKRKKVADDQPSLFDGLF